MSGGVHGEAVLCAMGSFTCGHSFRYRLDGDRDALRPEFTLTCPHDGAAIFHTHRSLVPEREAPPADNPLEVA